MSDALNDDEKKRFVQLAMHILVPIAEKYEMNDQNGRLALLEAFQEGIKFQHDEVKKIEEELDNG
jgi:hypothetical protein